MKTWMWKSMVGALVAFGITSGMAETAEAARGPRVTPGPRTSSGPATTRYSDCVMPGDLEIATDKGYEHYKITQSTRLCPDAEYRKPFMVRASDIHLNCAGATIDGSSYGRSGTYGLRVRGVSNVKVRNCIIRGFLGGGINVHPDPNETQDDNDLPDNIAIERVKIIENGTTGIFMRAKNSLIGRAIIKNNGGSGVYFEYDGHHNVLEDSIIEENGIVRENGSVKESAGEEGVAIDSSYSMTVQYNRIAKNGTHGVTMYWNCGERNIERRFASSGHKIVGNIIRYHRRIGSKDLSHDINRGAAVAVAVRQGKRGSSSCTAEPEMGNRYRDKAPFNTVSDNKMYNNDLGVYVADHYAQVLHNDFSHSDGNDLYDIVVGNVHMDDYGTPVGGALVDDNSWPSGKPLEKKRRTTLGTCGDSGEWGSSGECKNIRGNESVFSKQFLDHAF